MMHGKCHANACIFELRELPLALRAFYVCAFLLSPVSDNIFGMVQ
jgi:hypothetical protein